MAVCTNKPLGLATNALTQTGLAHYFDAVVAQEPGKPAKPDPAPLFEACRRMEADPNSSILIGDSETDAEAARSAGMCFVLVGYGYPVGQTEEIVSHFKISCASELPTVLATALYGLRAVA